MRNNYTVRFSLSVFGLSENLNELIYDNKKNSYKSVHIDSIKGSNWLWNGHLNIISNYSLFNNRSNPFIPYILEMMR